MEVEIVVYRFAQKQVRKLPIHIKEAFYAWIETIEYIGIEKMREKKSYHDGPLKGERLGQRSVRLNRSYRVIYEMTGDREVTILGVLEVNKHEY